MGLWDSGCALHVLIGGSLLGGAHVGYICLLGTTHGQAVFSHLSHEEADVADDSASLLRRA